MLKEYLITFSSTMCNRLTGTVFRKCKTGPVKQWLRQTAGCDQTPLRTRKLWAEIN